MEWHINVWLKRPCWEAADSSVLSVAQQGEDAVRLQLVGALQLLELDHHQAARYLRLQLLHQLTGGVQRPCSTHASQFNGKVPYIYI